VAASAELWGELASSAFPECNLSELHTSGPPHSQAPFLSQRRPKQPKTNPSYSRDLPLPPTSTPSIHNPFPFDMAGFKFPLDVSVPFPPSRSHWALHRSMHLWCAPYDSEFHSRQPTDPSSRFLVSPFAGLCADGPHLLRMRCSHRPGIQHAAK
jgi:hypothetical protein